ncbi:phosphoribosylglycinamide formyltransferase 2 [[Pasteurella] mairii]|uniref:Phosphoribosylglycinamide formyltransferase 2 n=1 Tax=[Pasteurella] mairii TaxID=757 RepID=A0A379B326_9PAST|nr:phosphoribosylglycinamide formyltransferase 2 [[Pasteurella] mairii]
MQFGNLAEVLAEPNTNIRLFGKGEVDGHRRMGVLLASDNSVEDALAKVKRAYDKLAVKL